MKCPPLLPDELERLQALAEYGFGDERPLPSLDPVVRIAARMFGMPVAAVNMIGSDHVFFAASTGVGEVDMRRDVSFCAHAITQDQVMVVPDAALDERFHDNPLVTGAASLRFYAGVPLRSPGGYPLGALCIIDTRPRQDFSDEDRERLRELARMASDRLELQRLNMAARQARPRFDTIAGNSPTPVVCFDAAGRIVAWNAAAAALHGYDPAEVIDQPLEMLIPDRDRPAFRRMIEDAVATGSPDAAHARKEVRGLRKDGQEFLLELAPFCWREDGELRFSAILQDITERRRHEEDLQRLASFDALTGLANRSLLQRRTEQTLAAGRAATIVTIGIDSFKDVNNTLGPAVGDGILREVADRLPECAGPDDTVARIGGDEFAILLPDLADPGQAKAIADEAITAIARPIVIDGHEIRVAASSGIAIGPTHAHDALELIANADLALFKAKSGGKRRSFVFVPALRMEAAARRLYDVELHRAVEKEELLLYFQPQLRLRDGALAGAEALLRWQHPERGLLSPAAFLPALEGGPLAATVGEWILNLACAQVAAWRKAGAAEFRVGVNLFGAQFRVNDLAATVTGALRRQDLPPDALELEITENIVLDHDDVVLEPLRRLRDLGVGIAFDDFGTGYASLSLLKRYPLSRIKIDRGFVHAMIESRQDASVVRAILDMAHSFGLETTAEGIETEAQRDHLRNEGCDEGQGHLFGEPMSVVQFAETFGIGDARPDAAIRR